MAQVLCGHDSRTDGKGCSACLQPLIRLATYNSARNLLEAPSAKWNTYSESDFNADAYVGAVYLGHRAYVQKVISETEGSVGQVNRESSHVFGKAIRAGTMSRNLDMIKLILYGGDEYRSPSNVEYLAWEVLLKESSSNGHHVTFQFSLDIMPWEFLKHSCRSIEVTRTVQAALEGVRMPEHYERLAALLDLSCPGLNSYPTPREDLESRLNQS